MNVLLLNGNHFINKVNPTLSQIEQCFEIKMNNLFKINLRKLRKQIISKDKIFILTDNQIVIKNK